jgi:hypothetical protein
MSGGPHIGSMAFPEPQMIGTVGAPEPTGLFLESWFCKHSQ